MGLRGPTGVSVFNEEQELPVWPTEVSYGFRRLHCSPPWEEARLSAVPRRAWAMIPERLRQSWTRLVPCHQQERGESGHGDAEKDEEEFGKQIKDS